jgi:5'-methylthioadenosine phosphorylase
MKPTIGIIGGSGLYSMPGFEVQEERTLETPWGTPSDAYVVGKLAGKDVAFLARHGRGHRISPSELNFRANIYGMKMLGVERILSLSAVGSLKEEHQPLDFVIPDQFVDRTRGRVSTFFGDGLVAHIRFVPNWRTWRTGRPTPRASVPSWAERICAWKDRRFRRWPNRNCIAVGAWT